MPQKDPLDAVEANKCQSPPKEGKQMVVEGGEQDLLIYSEYSAKEEINFVDCHDSLSIDEEPLVALETIKRSPSPAITPPFELSVQQKDSIASQVTFIGLFVYCSIVINISILFCLGDGSSDRCE